MWVSLAWLVGTIAGVVSPVLHERDGDGGVIAKRALAGVLTVGIGGFYLAYRDLRTAATDWRSWEREVASEGD